MLQSQQPEGSALVGRVAIAAVATGSLAAVAPVLGSTATANASCVAAAGFSSGPDCQAGLFSAAIALGPNSTASASGFSVASVFGANSHATTASPFWDGALVVGNYNTVHETGNVLSNSVTVGNGNTVHSGGSFLTNIITKGEGNTTSAYGNNFTHIITAGLDNHVAADGNDFTGVAHFEARTTT